MESQNQLPQQQLSRGTTFLRTCFNGINALSGVGILSIPYALSQGGWLSLILLFLVAILCWYTGLLLRRCMDAHPLIKTYPDVGELAFGMKGRTMIALFMYLELYLVAVEFLILEGDNLEKLFPDMSFKVAGLKIGGRQGFVLLAALVILPTTWLRSLGLLAYLSAGGVFASVIVVGCVFWAGAVDGVGFHERGMVLNWSGLPTTISLFVFCYCGHAIFPTLCTSMKDKSQFSKVLLICFALSTINYGSMAILGYLMFGENLRSQVTLNLPTGKMSSKLAIYTTLINPLTKYGIIITPIANAIEDTFSFHNSRPISVTIRTALVISTVVVALTVPFFGYIMEFIGAFLSVTVSMLFPCVFYLKINKASRSFGLELIAIIAILALGSFVAVTGTYTSLRQIINHL
ncbi:Amino acid transporter AVT1I [Vitis vinifera]|uniref:Amino acid transporter AVT1I n=1 Tax=Vitis vinifera TaxID=29760 RepID=A0A438G7I8_VITVI|nr:Amino acid transporter AVT1I [Vitis vinifera]RVW68179.1 Amino acid transporter AVT1I [Vitis vinifera]